MRRLHLKIDNHHDAYGPHTAQIISDLRKARVSLSSFEKSLEAALQKMRHGSYEHDTLDHLVKNAQRSFMSIDQTLYNLVNPDED